MGRQTGRDIGQGLGGFFGVDVQDPAMAKASKLRELGAKYGTDTAEALRKIASEIKDPELALQLNTKANEMEKTGAEIKLKQAQVAKETRAAGMEEQLRNELAALGPDATEEDVLKLNQTIRVRVKKVDSEGKISLTPHTE